MEFIWIAVLVVEVLQAEVVKVCFCLALWADAFRVEVLQAVSFDVEILACQDLRDWFFKWQGFVGPGFCMRVFLQNVYNPGRCSCNGDVFLNFGF